MIGYINAFRMFAVCSFAAIPFILLFRTRKPEQAADVAMQRPAHR
jgi:hypothetical protein